MTDSPTPLEDVFPEHLVTEHRINRIMHRYEQLRADPEEWISYRAETQLTDNAAGDGLPSAGDEYPEHNR